MNEASWNDGYTFSIPIGVEIAQIKYFLEFMEKKKKHSFISLCVNFTWKEKRIIKKYELLLMISMLKY